MAQANQYFATQIHGAMPAMQEAQQYGIRNTLAQQQGILFQQGQQDRTRAQENDTLFKNALVKFLGPVNAGMVTGDASLAPQTPAAMPSAPSGPPNTMAGPTQQMPPDQNALAQMLQANPDAGLAIARFQQQQQAQAFEQQQAVRAAQIAAEKAKGQQLYNEALWVEDSINNGASLKSALEFGLRDRIAPLRAQIGEERWAELTDEDLKPLFHDVKARAANMAGILPEKEEPVTLAEGAQLRTKKGKLIAENPKDTSTRDLERQDKMFQRANVLRDEYNTANKDFGAVQAQYQNIVATSAEPSSAGDLSLIFSYMKMLDPASTVREGEFATAQNSGSAWNRVGAMYNKIMSGERLTTEQRTDFTKQAANIFNKRLAQKEKLTQKYSDFARRTGVDPLDVVGAPEGAAPPPPGAQPTDISDLLKKYGGQ